ncbi:hypothetical protein CKM354_001212100 [Cercospora kikuchii]|uniref:F-box domain-containing protein n=1 Tax=Cercospora kikuchii TaxID=84275 RepID=A0A9P3FIX9_9PEZI|nr:uncharacterized protein CKM354_001212100 [Cercospora kikuchii]GIZ49081.1 hypothetical protein CKM354_001212100 [Cercospora kikuchii]
MFSTDLDRGMRFYSSELQDVAAAAAAAYLQPYNPVRLVFNTTELLELILLELDMKTLLLSQATSHMFHSTIMASPRLRQKLWFDPTPSPNYRSSSSTSSSSPFATTSTDHTDASSSSYSPPPAPPILNPLLQSVISRGTHSHIRFLELDTSCSLSCYPALTRRLKPFDPPTVCIAMAPKARTAKFAGSWKDMLVLQPYDTRTRWDAYHYRWATREWDFRFTGTFEDEGLSGPRMGRVVRFVGGPGFEGGK